MNKVNEIFNQQIKDENYGLIADIYETVISYSTWLHFYQKQLWLINFTVLVCSFLKR